MLWVNTACGASEPVRASASSGASSLSSAARRARATDTKSPECGDRRNDFTPAALIAARSPIRLTKACDRVCTPLMARKSRPSIVRTASPSSSLEQANWHEVLAQAMRARMIAARRNRQRRAAVGPDLDTDVERCAGVGESLHRFVGQFGRQAHGSRASARQELERRFIVDVDQRTNREAAVANRAHRTEVVELDVEPGGEQRAHRGAFARQRRKRQRGQRHPLAGALEAFDRRWNNVGVEGVDANAVRDCLFLVRQSGHARRRRPLRNAARRCSRRARRPSISGTCAP